MVHLSICRLSFFLFFFFFSSSSYDSSVQACHQPELNGLAELSKGSQAGFYNLQTGDDLRLTQARFWVGEKRMNSLEPSHIKHADSRKKEEVLHMCA